MNQNGFEELKKEQKRDELKTKHTRIPAVAGKFYPGDSKQLNDWLKRVFSKFDSEPQKNLNYCKDIVGVVAPHAGYMYSGETAAKAINILPPADTYVLIGPNHTGYGMPLSVSYSSWNTPLGTVECDTDLFKYFENTSVQLDELGHMYEHSLEVHVPFIQYKNHCEKKNEKQSCDPNFKILPICMGIQEKQMATELGFVLANMIREEELHNKKVIKIIASSDLSHYVTAKDAKEVDMQTVEKICALDTDGLYDTIYKLNASACGYGPIAALMETAKNLSRNPFGKLLKYTTSGDVSGDYASVVGYAAIGIFA